MGVSIGVSVFTFMIALENIFDIGGSSIVSISLLNRYLISYGTDQLVAMGIVLKVNMIVMLVIVCFACRA